MSEPRRPRVRYAQNFLTDPRLVDRLLDASSIGPADLVYEIGPGEGIITERLVQRCRRVVAVERDPVLVRRLQRRFAAEPRVEIRAGDFIEVPLPSTPYKVFANIPFNRTAAIVTKLTRAACPPDDQYLVVQRDAADRFMGRRVTTLYAALLDPWFDVRVGFRFRRTDFTPPPGVEVVLLRIAKRGPPLVAGEHAQLYRDFVVSIFTAWRPGIGDALARVCTRAQVRQILAAASLAGGTKPSSLSLEGWLALGQAFQRGGGDAAHGRVAGAEARLLKQQAGLRKQHRTRIARTYATGPGPPAGCQPGYARRSRSSVCSLPRMRRTARS